MIIYGSRSSHVKSVVLEKETCPHCGSQGSLLLSTYSRYAHIFWIPIFPIGRISVSQCQHCRQILESKQMPSQIKAYHERNLAETRIPIWQFAGLALIAAFIVLGIVSNKNDKKQQAEFLRSPMEGDVYEYKTKTGYTTFKLTRISNDTVSVSFNNYEVDKMTGLYKIDKTENYSDTTYRLSRQELVKMYAAGEVFDINRR